MLCPQAITPVGQSMLSAVGNLLPHVVQDADFSTCSIMPLQFERRRNLPIGSDFRVSTGAIPLITSIVLLHALLILSCNGSKRERNASGFCEITWIKRDTFIHYCKERDTRRDIMLQKGPQMLT